MGWRRRRGGGREQGVGRTRREGGLQGRTRERLRDKSLRIGLRGTKGYYYGVVITHSSKWVAMGMEEGEREGINNRKIRIRKYYYRFLL